MQKPWLTHPVISNVINLPTPASNKPPTAQQIGDSVAPGDLYCEVETDKATIGWESQEEGFVAQILLPSGAKDVAIGTPALVLVEDKETVAAFASFTAADAGGKAAAPAAAAPAAAAPAAAPAAPKAAAAPAAAPRAAAAASAPSGGLVGQPASRRGGRAGLKVTAARFWGIKGAGEGGIWVVPQGRACTCMYRTSKSADRLARPPLGCDRR